NGAAGWSSLALASPSAVNGSSAAPAPRTSARASTPRIAAATPAGPTRRGMVAFPEPIRYGVCSLPSRPGEDMARRLRPAVVAPLPAPALAAAGAAADPRLLPIRLDPTALEGPAPVGPLTDYPPAVRAISAVMARDLGLPLPSAVTLFVYPTRAAY